METPQDVAPSLIECFEGIPDPRANTNKRHKLVDILVIAICAVIAGADEWTHIEAFGKAKKDWFKGFLELPFGIPSHDTFGRVFAMLSLGVFGEGFLEWVQSVVQKTNGQVIPIDGKTVRHSYDTKAGKAAIHVVSAWASQSRLALGQVKTEAKSNEITAIPTLLDLLDVKGCIVTTDAMGCQKTIAAKIIEKGGDYVLAIKDNQPGLLEEAKMTLEQAFEQNSECALKESHRTEETGHGRHEIREYYIAEPLQKLTRQTEWTGLRCFGMVKSTRTVGDKTTHETRHYAVSLPCDAKRFANAARSHWGIENSLHWCLDVSFGEDQSRVRQGNAAENFSMLRRMALNVIRQDPHRKCGVKAARLRAGWDMNYFKQLLGIST